MTAPRRADVGPDRQVLRRREMQRRMRAIRRQGRHSRRRFQRGFGCLAGLVFIIVAASILLVVGSLLASLGPVPAVIAVAGGIGIMAAVGRGLRGAARSLDLILDATGRVEGGDYGVRIGRPESDVPAIQSLAAGFDTMAARLEADDEQRRTLLADISHELRTPLAVITGNLEAIIDGVYPPDAAHLAPILEETRVLERLIDDLRTITLAEAGTLPLYPEPTDPDVLIGDVMRAFTPGAATAGVTLATAIDGDLPLLEIDPVRIREVLTNLVANALRHTPSGGAVTLGGGTAEPGWVTLTVADTGPGIDPALLPHVFDRFIKGDDSRGSGLGLAIARGLVEAHGGTIAVTTPAGGGTTFAVRLPRPTGE